MELSYFTIIFGILSGIILFFNPPRLTMSSREKSSSKIKLSIIIPARNEEHNLPNILSDIKNQTYDIHEVICVDDNSDDHTPDIIQKYGATYVALKSLPEGWKGKPWACQNGAKHATGDILLFLDADVRLNEHAIFSLVKEYEKKQGPISVQPYHTMKKQHEFFSLFFNLIQISATAMSFFSHKKTLGFYGPVLLIEKTLFDQYDGYSPVKNNVAEDFNLGRFYNKKGIFVDCFLGSHFIKFQMYPNHFLQLVEGWSKNFATGAVSTTVWLLILNFFWIAGLTALPYELLTSFLSHHTIFICIYSFLYIFDVFFIFRIAKKLGSFPFYVCVLFPLYLLIFHLVFFYSIFATFLLKSTTWKGRKL